MDPGPLLFLSRLNSPNLLAVMLSEDGTYDRVFYSLAKADFPELVHTRNQFMLRHILEVKRWRWGVGYQAPLSRTWERGEEYLPYPPREGDCGTVNSHKGLAR